MTADPASEAGAQDETPWLEQGSVFESVKHIPALSKDGTSLRIETPRGVVVVSQTCDNVRTPWVVVVPVVELTEAQMGNVRTGSSTRYAELPSIGANICACLETAATIDKRMLCRNNCRDGVASPLSSQKFGQAIGRRYARFAFPDEIVAWLSPLRKVALEKARRPNSPEGMALGRIRQIRLRSETGWESAPYVLGFTFLLDEGEMTFDDNSETLKDGQLESWIADKGPADIADRLALNKPLEQARLMLALGEAWVKRCAERGVKGVVSDFSVDLASADEYSLASFWGSEALDLDHLSSPAT